MERRLKTIASRDNPLFKTLRRLARDASARRDEKLAILEGVHLCEVCLASGALPRYCAVGQSSLAHPEVAAIVAALGDRMPASHFILLDDMLFDALSQVGPGISILFAIDVPQFAVPGRVERSCVVLDRIQDPGNVGSILRSAAAAGIVDIYLSPGSAGAMVTRQGAGTTR